VSRATVPIEQVASIIDINRERASKRILLLFLFLFKRVLFQSILAIPLSSRIRMLPVGDIILSVIALIDAPCNIDGSRLFFV